MKKQAGISLIVVLIGLVIVSFAAIALLRSTDTATLIAGNLGFKKAALASGDAGTEAAIVWLNGNAAGNTLHEHIAAQGYYANSADACDLTGSATPNDPADDVQWGDDDPGIACQMVGFEAAPVGDYRVRYVINRMCNVEGNPASALAADGVTARVCSRADGSDSGSSTLVGPSYGFMPFSGSSRIYYRITTQVTGPRNTTRYVQAFVVL